MRYSFTLPILLLLGCSEMQEQADTLAPPAIAIAQAPPDNTSADESESKTLIIKNGNFKFQVANVDTTTRHIEKIIQGHQGFIADMNLITNHSEISNHLVIRVPGANFERLIEDLNTESVFTDYKKITTEDVTEQFIDIESRLKTKREVRDRYVDILKNKAKTVEDVLKAEREISVLQEEIESKEGRLKYLQNKVSFSTLNLAIYQPVEFKESPATFSKPYMAKIKEGFSNGWSIITTLLLFAVNIWPLLLLFIFIFWRRKWIREKLVVRAKS